MFVVLYDYSFIISHENMAGKKLYYQKITAEKFWTLRVQLEQLQTIVNNLFQALETSLPSAHLPTAQALITLLSLADENTWSEGKEYSIDEDRIIEWKDFLGDEAERMKKHAGFSLQKMAQIVYDSKDLDNTLYTLGHYLLTHTTTADLLSQLEHIDLQDIALESVIELPVLSKQTTETSQILLKELDDTPFFRTHDIQTPDSYFSRENFTALSPERIGYMIACLGVGRKITEEFMSLYEDISEELCEQYFNEILLVPQTWSDYATHSFCISWKEWKPDIHIVFSIYFDIEKRNLLTIKALQVDQVDFQDQIKTLLSAQGQFFILKNVTK